MAKAKVVKKEKKKSIKEIENGALALLMLFSCIIGMLLGYLLSFLTI